MVEGGMIVSTERRTATLESIRRAAERAAAELGLEVVELTFHGGGRRGFLRVDIDRPGPSGVGIEDCQRFSGRLSQDLDDGDLIEESYTLEVSSPGIDRPIRTDDDLRRNLGRRVLCRMADGTPADRELRGVLAGFDGAEAVLRLDDGQETRITRARIVRFQQDPEF